MEVQSFEFQAEARQLLDLMIHSVYSNRDVFLRELISNASDALDKLRVESLRDGGLRDLDSDPHIRIEVDRAARTLSIIDNGIGMNREELIANIGTIARSGTREFIEMLKAGKESDQAVSADLIGQFGVGFYSVFMVADRVTLLTRRAGEDTAHRWESTGDGRYTLADDERSSHGATITLHLKASDDDEPKDYTQEWTIREIVKKYSDFVTYPIRMAVERTENVDGEDKTVMKDETLNSMKAIWTRSKDQVSPEEYNEFYRHVSHDWTSPLKTIQMKAEGAFEYYALLFIPLKAPLDLFVRSAHRGLQLYVRRVFITDAADDLMPEYLRFVKGVVDSEDLPLNVSRELLQQNRQIPMIRKRLTKKVLDTIAEMRDGEPDSYRTFWKEFGSVIKEGIFQDQENSQSILGVSAFATTQSGDNLISLKEYIERMKPGQEAIYYIVGDDRAKLMNSPHLEAFNSRGYEALLLSDPVDGIWTSSEPEFEGRAFRSVARGMVELGSEEERKESETKRAEGQREYGELLSALKQRLGERIKDVRLSSRLTSSAVCLVSDEGDPSPQLERLMRAMGQDAPPIKRIVELNPDHPLLARLQSIYDSDHNDPTLADYAELLYGQAVLAEGDQLDDPAAFSKLVADLMVRA